MTAVENGAGRFLPAFSQLAIGGVLGLIFAFFFLRLVVNSLHRQFATNLDFAIDLRVFAFMLAASLIAALIAGLLPGLRASRNTVLASLKQGSGGTATGRQPMRRVLVIAEIALSFILLIGAGLLIRSFLRMQHTDPGHHVQDLLIMELSLPADPYGEPVRRSTFYEQALERIRHEPGVALATACSSKPFASWDQSYIRARDDAAITQGSYPITAVQRVADDYFETFGMALRHGRAFSRQDTTGSQPVAMVNASLADRLWPDGDAIGRQIWIGGDEVWRSIVGVVPDVRRFGLGSNPEFDVYLPYRQSPSGAMALYARANGRSTPLASALRKAVRATDPLIPVDRIERLPDALAGLTSPQRAISLMLTAFGISALVLALAGLYGFVTYHVAQRTQEIGLRVAMGARSRCIVGLILRRMLSLVFTGLGLGVLGAIGAAQLVRGFLFETSPLDPLTYTAAAILFFLAAGIACLPPAIRASRLPPVVALRIE